MQVSALTDVPTVCYPPRPLAANNSSGSTMQPRSNRQQCMLFYRKYEAMRSTRLLFVVVLFAGTFALHRPAVGGESAAKEPVAAEQPSSPSITAEPQAPASPDVTPAAIENIRRQATEAEEFADPTRSDILDLCDKAIVRLKDAGQLAATTALLQKELDEAGSALESLQSKPTEAESEPLPTDGLSTDEMRARLSAADQRSQFRSRIGGKSCRRDPTPGRAPQGVA